MDYLNAINVSLTGLDFNRTKMDVIALNLANINAVQSSSGEEFKPLVVSANPSNHTNLFSNLLNLDEMKGVKDIEIRERNVSSRMVYDPTHPVANEAGYVFYPNVNAVEEMTELVNATRSYEANVKALNLSKHMALKALEIGQ